VLYSFAGFSPALRPGCPNRCYGKPAYSTLEFNGFPGALKAYYTFKPRRLTDANSCGRFAVGFVGRMKTRAVHYSIVAKQKPCLAAGLSFSGPLAIAR